MVSVEFKPLAGIILRLLLDTRERCVHGNQAGFHPDQDCTEQFFALCNKSENTGTSRRPMNPVFLDLKAALDSVDRTIFGTVSHGRMLEKLVSLVQSVYANIRDRVYV